MGVKFGMHGGVDQRRFLPVGTGADTHLSLRNTQLIEGTSRDQWRLDWQHTRPVVGTRYGHSGVDRQKIHHRLNYNSIIETLTPLTTDIVSRLAHLYRSYDTIKHCDKTAKTVLAVLSQCFILF